MAKKSTRRATAPKGPMSVDKSSTPAWMRIVILLVVISFAVGGVAVVAAGVGSKKASTSTSGSDKITAEYQPRVDAARAAMQSSPDNPDIIAQVGHSYYEWAVALYQAGKQSASIPIWLSAVSYYDKSLAIKPDDNIVLGNRAFALYYSGDQRAEAALQVFAKAAIGDKQLAAQVKTAGEMLASIQKASSGTTSTVGTTAP